MCGIVGLISVKEFSSKEVLQRLKKLEYRGYDSWGYWNGQELTRKTGSILVFDDTKSAHCAISHTRWATHGGVTEANAHPHRAGKVTVVHNGIIENWRELKKILESRGRIFSSETDSELLAQYIDDALKEKERRIEDVLPELISVLKGTFALLIMIDGDKRLFAAKRDSPLALGICKDCFFLASDIYAFSNTTNKAIFFENDEYAIITQDSCAFMKDSKLVQKTAQEFVWLVEEENKGAYNHFMLKEIHESPVVCQRLLHSITGEQQEAFSALVKKIRSAHKVVFTAAGTAYHASLLGAQLLHSCGLEAQALIASEFENFVRVDDKTLVVAVSQSGETMDVIEALQYAKTHGAHIASIVNVPYSTIERLSDVSVHIAAGQEIAVASTKAFINQSVMLLALAHEFGYKNGLEAFPEQLKKVLGLEPNIRSLAEEVADKDDLYVLGRKLGYPVAREIALKIKEVSYIHAEGMMGGELKHGTIALIEEGTPVIGLVYASNASMQSSMQEVRARGARTIIIGTDKDIDICLPASSEAEFMVLAALAGQLLAYYLALARGRPIDKPRNLAKSVTVR